MVFRQKKDGQGNPVIDGNGAPVPQDGSYAYAIKKCAGIIKFTEDNEPVLIGTEDKYKRFENGENSGHIYVVDGKNFKPEYAANGSITEYTAQERPRLVNHINVSPKDAMEHNAQIIVFASDKLFDDWLKKARSKGGFNLQINKNSTVMASLAEEVRAGRAVYINATDRGMNPRISVLTDASQSFQKQTMIGAKFSELKTKLEQRKSINQSQQRTASAQTPQNNNDVFSQLKSQNTQE